MTVFISALNGPPTSGFYNTMDRVIDAQGFTWVATQAGFGDGAKWLGETATVAAGVVNPAAAVAATVSVVESGMGAFHKTVLTLTACPLTLVDANVGGGVLLYTLTKGRVLFQAADASLAFTTTSVLASTLNASVTINYGLGSVITAAQASGTLATTQQDILPTTNATASATINVAGAAAVGKQNATPVQLDGTTTAIPVNLNVGVAGATDIDADATNTVTGTINLIWVHIGAV